MPRGFSVIELLVTLAILGLLVAVAVPQYEGARRRAEVNAVGAESRLVYVAFKQHFVDREQYPNAVSTPKFELDTFEPLVSMGYYKGSIQSRIVGGRADAFDSPDDQGNNREFWLELSLRSDSTIRFLISDSDNAPLGGGTYRNGVFAYRNGILTPIHEIR